MLELHDISKSYNDLKALNGVSFTLRPGEVVGLLGPNGAGKSTLMKILTGYIKNWEGNIRYGEQELREKTTAIQEVTGYLPENNPLYPDLFVLEYLTFVASIYRIKDAPYSSILEKVGLNEVKHRKISSLSKGYQQRVGLAAALLHNPEILILDEPTTGLHFHDIQKLLNSFEALIQLGHTILTIEHNLEVIKCADWVIDLGPEGGEEGGN